MAGKIREITQKDYENTVLQDELAVLDFYSTECPPCEALAAKYEPLSGLYGGRHQLLQNFPAGKPGTG